MTPRSKPGPGPSRLRRAMRALRWAARSPRQALEYREWVLQELGLDRASREPVPLGARPRHMGPDFLRRHCRPLLDPDVVPAAAAEHMRDADVVLGVQIEPRARAYPWWIMDNHHVANDTLAGRALLVLLCEDCSTGVAFDPVIGTRRLTFEPRHIYNGTLALWDRETRGVWSPYLGRCISGRMKGTELPMLALVQMEWGLWRTLHPETDVLAGHLGSRAGHGSAESIGTPKVGGGMRSTIARWDTRLPHNTLVLGVITSTAQRAYPLEALRARAPVVTDRLGGDPIVVLLDPSPGSYAALAFSRRLGGRELTFAPGRAGPVDAETGSAWTAAGRAVSGPLAGARLDFVASHVAEWYVWAAHFPGIEIWE